MNIKEALLKGPIWLKLLITLFSVFTLSEIILRIYGYTGIVSLNALTIISASSKRFLLLLDNLILFAIVIFIPIIIARYLSKKIPTEHYKYNVKGKGPLYRSTITMKAPSKFFQFQAEGKGLIYGSFLAIIYASIDILFLKKIVPECSYYCGFENAFAFAFSLFYIITGFYLIKRKNLK